MSLLDKILGRPLASSQSKKESLTVLTGVPLLGLDALASTGYGPEAALVILLPLGLAGSRFFPAIMLAVVVTLILLYLSYRQTAAAYPNGGGSYIVASDNLGQRAGLWAAVALLIDYFLNVAVGISAGIGAIVSAFPFLQPYTLLLCLLVLVTLTLINVRGVKEAGLIFIIPVIVFVLSLAATMLLGAIEIFQRGAYQPFFFGPNGGLPAASQSVSLWLLLGAFANGLTAMTGVEAVSNAVPLFRKPSVTRAQITLTVIVLILSVFLLGLGFLCPAFHIQAMDQTQPGYQSVLSQLVAVIAGRGVFYYIASISIFIILTYSAQTSFADFPRVCRLLAEDEFLPKVFAERGRRLVYTHGILILAIFAGLVLIVFKGVTMALIPLFAIGAFSAFSFSQLGMVIYWIKNRGPQFHIKLMFNALGATASITALFIIVIEKFEEGAWMVLVLAPLLVLLLSQIKRHYKKIDRQTLCPISTKLSPLEAPIVIIPIEGWNRVAEKAVRIGMLLSDDITCVHVSTEKTMDKEILRNLWTEQVEKPAKDANSTVPKLEILQSPYRWIYKPILTFIKNVRKKNPDRMIAVIIPELIEPHWYELLLHSLHAFGLRTLLFLQRDPKIVVINVPWFIENIEKKAKK